MKEKSHGTRSLVHETQIHLEQGSKGAGRRAIRMAINVGITIGRSSFMSTKSPASRRANYYERKNITAHLEAST